MTKENYAFEQAELQLESIKEMVAALNCDYDRLEEARDEIKALDDERYRIEVGKGHWLEAHLPRYLSANDLRNNWALAHPDENDRLAEIEDDLVPLVDERAALEAQAGECKDREDAERRIHEDPLEVEVRSGWYAPGTTPEPPAEFLVLLCAGGPAVRIVGDLDEYGVPERARIEYQDWGTPWTEYAVYDADKETLLTYCRQFYFGE